MALGRSKQLPANPDMKPNVQVFVFVQVVDVEFYDKKSTTQLSHRVAVEIQLFIIQSTLFKARST